VTGNALVITWNPPPSRPLFTGVTISVAGPSPDARICYTATSVPGRQPRPATNPGRTITR